MAAGARLATIAIGYQHERHMPPSSHTFMEAAKETATDIAAAAETGAALSSNFRFVPRELAGKCRQLIESYHAIYGYVGLPTCCGSPMRATSSSVIAT
jgi:hypothetical protein